MAANRLGIGANRPEGTDAASVSTVQPMRPGNAGAEPAGSRNKQPRITQFPSSGPTHWSHSGYLSNPAFDVGFADSILDGTDDRVMMPLHPDYFEKERPPPLGGGVDGQAIWKTYLDSLRREDSPTGYNPAAGNAIGHIRADLTALLNLDYAEGFGYAAHPGSRASPEVVQSTVPDDLLPVIPECRRLQFRSTSGSKHMQVATEGDLTATLAQCAASIQWGAHPAAATMPFPPLTAPVVAGMDAPEVYTRSDDVSIIDWVWSRQKMSVLTTALLYVTAASKRLKTGISGKLGHLPQLGVLPGALFLPQNDPRALHALCPLFIMEDSVTGEFAAVPNNTVRLVVSGSLTRDATPTMIKASFRNRPWAPSRQELQRVMAPGYVQAHMLSVKIVGRMIMLVMPPLARPGASSGEVVFAEAPLPGMTAVPMAVFNHPEALHEPEALGLWKRRVETQGNMFLSDIMRTGTSPYPSLHRVEFTLGNYMLPEPDGMTQLVRLDPAAAFTRAFHSLRKLVMDATHTAGTVGLCLTVVDPVWIAN